MDQNLDAQQTKLLGYPMSIKAFFEGNEVVLGIMYEGTFCPKCGREINLKDVAREFIYRFALKLAEKGDIDTVIRINVSKRGELLEELRKFLQRDDFLVCCHITAMDVVEALERFYPKWENMPYDSKEWHDMFLVYDFLGSNIGVVAKAIMNGRPRELIFDMYITDFEVVSLARGLKLAGLGKRKNIYMEVKMTEEEFEEFMRMAYEMTRKYADKKKTRDTWLVSAVETLLSSRDPIKKLLGYRYISSYDVYQVSWELVDHAINTGLFKVVEEVYRAIPYAYRKHGRWRGIKAVQSWRVIKPAWK